MQLLDEKLKIGGFKLRQIHRHCDVAVYEQTSTDGESVSYEVVIIQRRPAETLFGKDYPEREIYPPNEKWGELGWTCTDRDRALDKANAVGVIHSRKVVPTQKPFHSRQLKHKPKTGLQTA